MRFNCKKIVKTSLKKSHFIVILLKKNDNFVKVRTLKSNRFNNEKNNLYAKCGYIANSNVEHCFSVCY